MRISHNEVYTTVGNYETIQKLIEASKTDELQGIIFNICGVSLELTADEWREILDLALYGYQMQPTAEN